MRAPKILCVAISAMLACVSPSIAWDGVNTDTGSEVSIEAGNLVRSGRTIEVYDWDSGAYSDIDIESITRSGGSVVIEGYDYNSGEYRTFEMQD